jgi:4-hydroxy-3-methylbut-2-en-1-yl diphosphate reductase
MTAQSAGADGFPEVPPRAELEAASVAPAEEPDVAAVRVGEGPDVPAVGVGERPDVAAVQAGEGPHAVGVRPDPQPDTRLVVCAPLLPEARAVRPGIGDGGEVRVSGYGPGRARRQAGRLRQDTFGALAVAGTAGGLTDELRPGDLVVATGVSDGSTTTACPSAPLLAGELRRAGLPVRAGPVVSVDRLRHGRERARLVDPAALAVELE